MGLFLAPHHTVFSLRTSHRIRVYPNNHILSSVYVWTNMCNPMEARGHFPQCHPDEMFALCPSHYNISRQPLSVWQFFSLELMKKPPHLDISKVKQCLLNNLLSSSVGSFLKQNLFANLELSSSAQLLAREPQETCLSPSLDVQVETAMLRRLPVCSADGDTRGHDVPLDLPVELAPRSMVDANPIHIRPRSAEGADAYQTKHPLMNAVASQVCGPS